MKTSDQLKKIVNERYSKIAVKSPSSCGCGCNDDKTEYSIISDEYAKLKGYNPEADLKLGCGLPTEFAKIEPGNTVVDLGSGAGNDCFVARALTGDQGRVIGIDFTDAMVKKAKKNASALNYSNVDFIFGDIENIPLNDETADVVVSNCVMNLVPDKQRAFAETYRIMKKGGHFSISDIVLKGDLPKELQEEAALYAGCISGALQKEHYIEIIRNAGFRNIAIQKEKSVGIPEDVFLQFMTREKYQEYVEAGLGIFSITVYAEK